MHLFLIRHGQAHSNLETWRELDNMDAALTDLGHQQCATLRDWMRAKEITADALYSSTMVRTRETTVYVQEALGLEPIFDDRIREGSNNFIDMQPIPWQQLPREFRDFDAGDRPFEGIATEGDHPESWTHLRLRVGEFMDEIMRKHVEETVYVVCHGGVIAATLDNVFNAGVYRHAAVHSENTSWTHLYMRPEPSLQRWVLLGQNRIDHLVWAETRSAE